MANKQKDCNKGCKGKGSVEFGKEICPEPRKQAKEDCCK